MKRRALAVVLTLMMIVSVLPMAAFAAKFSDTVGHWAESSIDRWTDEGVLQGVGDNMFMPNNFITRAETTAVFTRLLKLTETTDISNFADVSADSWYADYVSKAVAANIMNGTSATTFAPLGNITRQDFFLILARATGLAAESTCNYTGFVDLNQVSDYARGAVYALINQGYVNGRSATELQPLEFITRAEVAKVLDNVISYYITEDGSYNVSGDGFALVLASNVGLSGPFSGTVVAGAENGNIDMAGLQNPVNINPVKKGVRVTNAPADSVVTTGDDINATVNGIPVGEDSQQTIPGPDQPPAPPTPSTPTTPAKDNGNTNTPTPPTTHYYDVTLTLNLGGFTAQPIVLSASLQAGGSTPKTLKDALLALGDDPKLAEGIGEFLTHFNGTKTYNGYTVNMDSANRLITISGFTTLEDYQGFLDTLTATFNARRDAAIQAIDANYVAGNAVYDAWKNFTDTFSPANQVTATANGLKLDTAANYVTKYKVAVNFGDAFRAAALTDNANFDFAPLMGSNGIMKLDNTADIAKILTLNTLPQIHATKPSVTAMTEDTSAVANFTDFLAAVKNRTVADYTTGNAPAAAVWYSGWDSGTLTGLFQGTFTVSYR